MSGAPRDPLDVPHGVSLLAHDLTPEELSGAPALASLDALLIDGLSDDEDDAFAIALAS